MINESLVQRLLEFRRVREWEQFHTPKDLAISLVLEASELLELFQWKKDAELPGLLEGPLAERLKEEVADIAILLSYLCHDLRIDLNSAIEAKVLKNGEKYPVAKVRGSARKYNEYP
jgi:NTP pyrophosphatase (non-canonical NTP hydrolase)